MEKQLDLDSAASFINFCQMQIIEIAYLNLKHSLLQGVRFNALKRFVELLLSD